MQEDMTPTPEEDTSQVKKPKQALFHLVNITDHRQLGQELKSPLFDFKNNCA